VRGHLFNWGHDADYLKWNYTNRTNSDSVFTHFVADVQNTTYNMAVVIWLRGGGTTYKFSGRGVSSIDSSITSPKTLATNSEQYSKLTVAKTHFTRNAGQWDSRTNLLILDGVINPPTDLHTDTVGSILPSIMSTSTTALAVNGPLVLNSITHQKYSFSATPPNPFTSQPLDTLTSSLNYIFYTYVNYKIVINPRYGPGWYEIDYTNNSSGGGLQMGSALVAVLSELSYDNGVGKRYKMRRVRDSWYSGRINCDLDTDSSEVGNNSDSSASYGFIISNLTLSATYQFRIHYTAFPA
jgi:hypothetical protein